MRIVLRNNKAVFINDQYTDFSLALQIPIRNHIVVNELNKRRNEYLEANKSYGHVGEDSSRYHITVQLFFPKCSQIKDVIEVYTSVWKNVCIDDLELTTDCQVLGRYGKFPVALVKSEKLKNLHQQFQEALKNKNIKIQQFNDFTPHISLFCTAVSNVITPPEQTRQAMVFSGEAEISHKTDLSEFFTLAIEDMQELDTKTNAKTKTNLDENNNSKRTLIDKLQAYIKKINSYGNEDTKFSYGFRLFKDSQATNRKANYKLAEKLLSELESGKDIKEVFSNVNTKRNQIIELEGLSHFGHFNFGIYSKDLNEIIKLAKEAEVKDQACSPSKK